jgi:ubiquitin carboxyl-terminal hydrolase L5
MEKDVAILEMPVRNLTDAWEVCVKAAMPAKIAVEDEIIKSIREHVDDLSSYEFTALTCSLSTQTDHVKRTHDYEPFLREFFTSLYNESLLNPMLGRDEDGKKLPANRKGKGKASMS